MLENQGVLLRVSITFMQDMSGFATDLLSIMNSCSKSPSVAVSELGFTVKLSFMSA